MCIYPSAHGRQIIDLDESGVADDLPGTHGYPERGKRCDGILDWRARGRVNV
ncbi:MAG: IS630 family transposase, partial [Alphaproteobacteria bacterium]|nr:IS630 family transposase [Alphaproteobacteria bacterium]